MFDWIPDTVFNVIGIVLILFGVLLMYPCIDISVTELQLAISEDSLKERVKGYAISTACICAFILPILLGKTALNEVSARKYNHIVQCVESGYTLYINGAETDFSHITIEDYGLSRITVNDDIKEVHIAANK